jgi:hypothetical protein
MRNSCRSKKKNQEVLSAGNRTPGAVLSEQKTSLDQYGICRLFDVAMGIAEKVSEKTGVQDEPRDVCLPGTVCTQGEWK